MPADPIPTDEQREEARRLIHSAPHELADCAKCVDFIALTLARAVQAERERCAAVCERKDIEAAAAHVSGSPYHSPKSLVARLRALLKRHEEPECNEVDHRRWKACDACKSPCANCGKLFMDHSAICSLCDWTVAGGPTYTPAAPSPEEGRREGAMHMSDCAVHNAPALPVGPCDCKPPEPVPRFKPGDRVRVKDTNTYFRRRTGVIDELRPGLTTLGAVVRFDDGTKPYFLASELEPAPPETTEPERPQRVTCPECGSEPETFRLVTANGVSRALCPACTDRAHRAPAPAYPAPRPPGECTDDREEVGPGLAAIAWAGGDVIAAANPKAVQRIHERNAAFAAGMDATFAPAPRPPGECTDDREGVEPTHRCEECGWLGTDREFSYVAGDICDNRHFVKRSGESRWCGPVRELPAPCRRCGVRACPTGAAMQMTACCTGCDHSPEPDERAPPPEPEGRRVRAETRKRSVIVVGPGGGRFMGAEFCDEERAMEVAFDFNRALDAARAEGAREQADATGTYPAYGALKIATLTERAEKAEAFISEYIGNDHEADWSRFMDDLARLREQVDRHDEDMKPGGWIHKLRAGLNMAGFYPEARARFERLEARAESAEAERDILRKRVRQQREEIVRLHDERNRAIKDSATAQRMYNDTVSGKRAEKAEAAAMCDACAGTGAALSGPCMCGGTGRASDAVRYLRERLTDAESQVSRLTAERDAAREARDAVRRVLDAPSPEEDGACVRCGTAYVLREGCEPTPECDSCAHEVLSLARAACRETPETKP